MKVKLNWVDANPGSEKTLEIFRSDHYTTIENPGTSVVVLAGDITTYTDTVSDTAPTLWYRIKTTFPNGNWSMSDPFSFDGLTYNGPGNRSITLGDGFVGIMDVIRSQQGANGMPTLDAYETLLGFTPGAANTTVDWFKIMYHGQIYYIPSKACRVDPAKNWATIVQYLDKDNPKTLSFGKDTYTVEFPELKEDPITGIWRSPIMDMLFIGTTGLFSPQQNNIRAAHAQVTSLGYVRGSSPTSTYGVGYLIGGEPVLANAQVLKNTGEVVGLNEVYYTGVLPVLKYTRVPFEEGV